MTLIYKFILALEVELNYAKTTRESYLNDLLQWQNFMLLENKNFSDQEIINADLKQLKKFVYFLAKKRYKPSSQLRKISSLRAFYAWLFKKNFIKSNIASFLISPKQDKKLPKFLFEKELAFILESPLSDSFFDLRDFLIFDLLYSTGMRVSELASLTLKHFKEDLNQVLIEGKGSKQRLVFLSQATKTNLNNYLKQRLSLDLKTDSLLLSQQYKKLSVRGIQFVINQYIDKISLHKNVNPHMLRHSFATHLLNAGADIRSVQELLGHANLSTTQIYTHISKQKMKEQLQNHHPRG